MVLMTLGNQEEVGGINNPPWLSDTLLMWLQVLATPKKNGPNREAYPLPPSRGTIQGYFLRGAAGQNPEWQVLFGPCACLRHSGWGRAVRARAGGKGTSTDAQRQGRPDEVSVPRG